MDKDLELFSLVVLDQRLVFLSFPQFFPKEDLGFHRVQLLHLLADRETERTAIFEWQSATATGGYLGGGKCLSVLGWLVGVFGCFDVFGVFLSVIYGLWT